MKNFDAPSPKVIPRKTHENKDLRVLTPKGKTTPNEPRVYVALRYLVIIW